MATDLSPLDPTSIRKSLEREARRGSQVQYGALCYRHVKRKPQVLLITSRTRRRWIVPKGWPMDSVSPDKAATIEAREEAGVRGRAAPDPVGLYAYVKRGEGKSDDMSCVVLVYPLRVKALSDDYVERRQRRRKWFSPKQAAKKVQEPELRHLLRNFDKMSLL